MRKTRVAVEKIRPNRVGSTAAVAGAGRVVGSGLHVLEQCLGRPGTSA